MGVFALETGLFQRLRFGKPGGHERHLFRQLIESFSPGDVVLGDRGFCSFADIFLGRKHDGEPGVKALWLGFERLLDFVQGVEFV